MYFLRGLGLPIMGFSGLAICYAKADKAAQVLGWVASRPLNDMCRSTWKFQMNKALE